MAKYGSVLVIDDHKMIALGIKLLIGDLFQDFYMEHDGAAGISTALSNFPQLIIIDYTLPDTTGELLVKELRYKLPDAKLLAYTFTYSPDVIMKLLRSGINGYVIKNEDNVDFKKAVDTLMNGGDYFCKEAKTHIINRFMEPDDEVSTKHLIANTKFTSKEIELIRLLCKQKTTKEISLHLSLTERTVEQYRSHIIQRIGAKSIAGVVKFALQNGIVSLDTL